MVCQHGMVCHRAFLVLDTVQAKFQGPLHCCSGSQHKLRLPEITRPTWNCLQTDIQTNKIWETLGISYAWVWQAWINCCIDTRSQNMWKYPVTVTLRARSTRTQVCECVLLRSEEEQSGTPANCHTWSTLCSMFGYRLWTKIHAHSII